MHLSVESLTLYGVMFVNSLAFIGLRAFQQLNVSHDRFWWIPPTSLGMAVCEIVTITKVVQQGTLWAAVPMAAGAVLGSWAAMLMHRKLRK